MAEQKHILFIQNNKVIANKWVEELINNNFSFSVVSKDDIKSNTYVFLDQREPDVAVVDMNTVDELKFDLLFQLKYDYPFAEILILCSIEKLPSAVDAILKKGVFLYLPLPVSISDILKVAEKAIYLKESKKKLLKYESQIIYETWQGSYRMQKILRVIEKISPTDAPVIITGESGTGKEVLARYIHSTSRRYNDNFIPINCGAIPETLIESELFGHAKGSFTGADKDKQGLVETSANGTLFLDEIGDLPLSMQVKLLRFLQDKSFRRIGETAERYSNVRIIAATNKDLHTAVKNGTFREDLFYRLNVFHINIPPVRERKESLSILIKNFLARYNLNYKKEIKNIDSQAMFALAKYDYPGNIRELENIIEHATVMCDSDTITLEHLPESIKSVISANATEALALTSDTHESWEKTLPALNNNSNFALNGQNRKNPDENSLPIDKNFVNTLEEMEKKYILEVLTAYNNNYTETAKVLGISRATLWRKLKELNQ